VVFSASSSTDARSQVMMSLARGRAEEYPGRVVSIVDAVFYVDRCRPPRRSTEGAHVSASNNAHARAGKPGASSKQVAPRRGAGIN
jgi:hypothetical protein